MLYEFFAVTIGMTEKMKIILICISRPKVQNFHEHVAFISNSEGPKTFNKPFWVSCLQFSKNKTRGGINVLLSWINLPSGKHPILTNNYFIAPRHNNNLANISCTSLLTDFFELSSSASTTHSFEKIINKLLLVPIQFSFIYGLL